MQLPEGRKEAVSLKDGHTTSMARNVYFRQFKYTHIYVHNTPNLLPGSFAYLWFPCPLHSYYGVTIGRSERHCETIKYCAFPLSPLSTNSVRCCSFYCVHSYPLLWVEMYAQKTKTDANFEFIFNNVSAVSCTSSKEQCLSREGIRKWVELCLARNTYVRSRRGVSEWVPLLLLGNGQFWRRESCVMASLIQPWLVRSSIPTSAFAPLLRPTNEYQLWMANTLRSHSSYGEGRSGCHSHQYLHMYVYRAV